MGPLQYIEEQLEKSWEGHKGAKTATKDESDARWEALRREDAKAAKEMHDATLTSQRKMHKEQMFVNSQKDFINSWLRVFVNFFCNHWKRLK